jgi:hypothetical protein
MTHAYWINDGWIRGVDSMLRSPNFLHAGTARDVAANAAWAHISSAQTIANISCTTGDIRIPTPSASRWDLILPPIPFNLSMSDNGVSARVCFEIACRRVAGSGSVFFRVALLPRNGLESATTRTPGDLVYDVTTSSTSSTVFKSSLSYRSARNGFGEWTRHPNGALTGALPNTTPWIEATLSVWARSNSGTAIPVIDTFHAYEFLGEVDDG